MRTSSFAAPALLLVLASACTRPEQPTTTADAPPTRLEVAARGEYLVDIMGCGDCHSPKLMGPQGPYPDPARSLSGHPANEPLPPLNAEAMKTWVLFGMGQTVAAGPWGISFAGNLTSDATGIGTWSEEQFKRALTKGMYKGLEGGRPLLPPMPWQNYAHLSDADVHAIFTYLRSTKPVENVVPTAVPPDPSLAVH
ncbi:MAG: diheme cytochrome c-553 [Flavobacteriales bacterium]